MTLEETLSAIRQRQLLLTGQATLWAPNTHVTQDIRKAITRHRAALLCLVAESDIRMCASPGLHRRYWKHRGGQRYICCKCEELLPFVSE